MAVYRIPFWRRRFAKNVVFLLPQGAAQTLALVAEASNANAGDNVTLIIGHVIASVADGANANAGDGITLSISHPLASVTDAT